MLHKTVLTLGLAALAHGAFAQTTSDEILKPTTGTKNLEVVVNPFTSDPVRLFDGFKFRYFTSPTTAIRIAADIRYSHSSTVTQDAQFGDPELRTYSNNFGIRLRPGIEKHLAGTRRLSPYFGGELLLGVGLSNVTEEVEGPNQGDIRERKISNDAQNAGITLGLNGLAGVDIYLIQNLYLGVEFGMGIGYFTAFDTKTTGTDGTEVTTREDKGSNFSLNPYAVSGIRLGYNF